MNRQQLEHIIRAAAVIAEDDEIVIIGSQSVLGQFPQAPEEMLRSMEADVYARRHPERSDLIEGSLGEGSAFHETFGYYAQGVAPETAVLPRDWESRAVLIRNPNTRGATGVALEIHDLLVAKYAAAREKDLEFGRAAFRHQLATPSVVIERLENTSLPPEQKAHAAMLVRAGSTVP
jgi:hypothetical protein